MKRITQSLITQYRREIATSCAFIASLLIVGKLAPIGTHNVVIANHDLPVGSQVSAADLGSAKSRSWPNEIRNVDDVIGKTIGHNVPAGAMVTTTDLLAAQLPDDGRVQVSIPTSATDTQLLASGMHIDVYSPSGLIAENAIVVSVSKDQKNGIFNSTSTSSVVISVLPTDVAPIAVAKEQAQFTLALRSSN